MMNRPYNMYAKGGLKQEGGQKDEVSGNKVPLGGTKEGVRDDIDANLSAGEWVADEATTRYHGLKTFLGMRDEAMMGMKKMEAMGLMGNAEEATLPSDIPFGMADLIVVDIDEENGEEKEIDMAKGGMAIGGTIDLSGQQQDVPMRKSTPSVTFDEVMADAKMEFKEYRNAEGQSLMVPFIGGVPMYPIPEGYTLYTGEGGETPAVPSVPGTGADDITPSATDDDKDSSSIDAYRASAKDTSIDWASLSDEEFLNKANERNGFGRNLAMGVASLINPLAAVGMGALLRYEDMKVLEMAKARLNNIPPNQRAAYEQMIKEYEDRGKGLFGGVIDKIIGTVGDMLGLNEEQIQRGSNANLLSHSRNIDTYANPQGQATQEAIDALNTGSTGTFTTEQYAKANKIIADYQTDPTSVDKAVYDTAITNMSNHIGEELGNWVNPEIMNAVQTGGEETRLALVNAVYQNIDGVKAQLDDMSDTQKAFLGYDGTNYRDVVDTLREDASQILPVGTPRDSQRLRVNPAAVGEFESSDPSLAPFGLTETSRAASYERAQAGTGMGMLDTSDSTSMPITRDFTTTTTATADPTGTSTTQFLETQRKDQVQKLVDVGVDRNLAEATIPAASTSFTTPEQTGLEAMEAPMPTTDVSAPSEDVPAPSYATQDMGEAGRGTSYQPIQTVQPTTTDQTTAAFQPTVTTTTGTGTGRDFADTPVTGAQQAYASAAQNREDPYDPRNITRVPSEQTTNIPVSVTAQMDTGALGGGDLSSDQISSTFGARVQDPAVVDAGQQVLGSFDTSGSAPSGLPASQTEQLRETLAGTKPTVDTVTISGFEAGDPRAAGQQEKEVEEAEAGTPATDLKLKDIIPETGVTTEKESFSDAFARNRAAGAKTFTFEGKSYTTETAEEAAARKADTKTSKVTGKYDPTANKSLSGGFTTNTLSDAEQTAFDAAVDRGDSNVADHFASVNRLRNKQDAYAESGFDPAVGASLGLSANDMEQAEKYGGSIQTAINEGRAESQGILKPVKVTDTSKSKSSSNDDSSPSVSTPSTDKTKNVASSGRTEAEIQADINKELAGGQWTERANELVKERDSARANEGSSNDDGGGGGGSSGGGGGGCCFIMLEARYGNGTMDEVVRRYRDEHMTERNRRGYYKVAEVLVPLMRKSSVIKWLVTKTFADPLVSYGKYYYGQNKHGVLYSPVKNLWMKLFDTIGGDTEFIRENGEVV